MGDNTDIFFAYPGNNNYFVTKTGDVYSSYIKGGNGKKSGSLRLLKYGEDKDGYYRVVLCDGGNKKYKKVHQIIAETFFWKLRKWNGG